MLNNTGITKTSGVSPVQILFDPEHQISVSIQVGNTGITADAAGRKIAKAGTPLAGDLTNRSAPFAKAADATVKGILLHDVDVTKGNNNGSLLIFGPVNLSRLDTTTAALITETVKTALPLIPFLND